MQRIQPIPQYDWGIQKGDYLYPPDSQAVAYMEFARRRKLIRKVFSVTMACITFSALLLLIFTIG